MIWENVLLAFSSLKSNKMRALLTMLGIIIGIMSIITIVIIGDAMTATVSGNLATLGSNNVMVSIQERADDNALSRMGINRRVSTSGKTPASEDLITDEMIDELKEQFSDTVQGVSLSFGTGQATAQDGELYHNVTLQGTNADYFLANDITLLSGRLTSDEDVDNFSRSAVVSDRMVKYLFPGVSDPIGRQIKIYTPREIQIYSIIGVYEYVNQNIFFGTEAEQDVRTEMYIPISTARLDIREKNYTFLTVITATDTDVVVMTNAIQGWFDGIYAGNETWRVNVTNMTSVLDILTETMGTISAAIALIAGISLVVGGIGVMNIMLVSVTERTREIGTRKALGAKNFHIQFQFVIEALIIALVGGVIGMLLGVALGAAITVYFESPLVISPFVVLGSMFFSMTIGIFFGLYPANKAAKLDPIEALRYE
jgi:putative ABC transport system permease protein